MKRITCIVAALAAAVLVSSCMPAPSGNVYSRGETRLAWTVDYGRVVDVDEVVIEGQRTQLGTIGGGFIGYEVGRSVGSGTGRAIGGAVGAVAGAVAGQATEERLTRTRGYQITVEIDGGKTVAVVQAADERFEVGQRVKVLRRGDGAARITRA